MMLTPKQTELLGFIKSYAGEKGYAPSYDEMLVALGLKSKSGVKRLMTGLEERGAIKTLPRRSRAIQIMNGASAESFVRCEHCGELTRISHADPGAGKLS